MIIEWYPGHMAKAKRRMEEDVKKVDIVIEILDARAPKSCENPDIEELVGSKKRLIILNKADLADKAVTSSFKSMYEAKGLSVAALNSRNTGIRKEILIKTRALMTDRITRDKARGIRGARPVRAMVAGIPNVGKSTLINSIASKRKALTGDKAGVTRGNQWINIDDELLLLDTPGVLYPRIGSEEVSERLALIGSVNDDIVDMYELSLRLIEYLYEYYGELIKARYDLGDISAFDPADTLRYIANRLKAIKKGGEADLDKAARILIDDFRKGRIGRISLERP